VEVIRVLAGRLVRRAWRATLLLGLLAGLAAGIAMAAVSAGRRTATVFDRFVERADPPELIATFCPPDVTEVDDESIAQCFGYDAAAELTVVRQLSEVEDVGRARFLGLTAARPHELDRLWTANSTIVREGELASMEGDQILVSGRWHQPNRADEVVMNERFRDVSGVEVGEELVLTFWSPSEMGTLPEPGRNFSGPSARVRVVGVFRGLLDLAVSTDLAVRSVDEAKLLGGPALADQTMEAGGFGGLLVQAQDDNAQAAAAAIERAFGDRPINIAPAVGAEDLEPIREAINYEAGAAIAFGTIAALAAAVFIGQAVARQSRLEWTDLPMLRVLGLSARELRWTACLRGAVIGAAASLVAVATAVALSPLGPIGVGRRAEVEPGIWIDEVVLVIGAVAVLVLLTISTWLPLRQLGHAHRDEPPTRRTRLSTATSLPAPALVSRSIAARRGSARRQLRSAEVAVAFAVAAVVAAASLTASLDTLINTPKRFGADWDMFVTSLSRGTEPDSAIEGELRDEPMVEAAAAIVGTDVAIAGRTVWAQAFRQLNERGTIGPVITAGRQPVAIDEVALGSVTMTELDVEIGDTVVVAPTVTGGTSSTVTIVGTTVVNDTYEPSPGRGAMLTIDWFEANSPESTPDPYVVRLQPGIDPQVFEESFEAEHAVDVDIPAVPRAIGNVDRIASLPFVLAALIGVFAVASMAHALTLSVRRAHGQLAVWAALGLTRRQIRFSACWYAGVLTLVPAVVGGVAGILIGRFGWQTIARKIGVADDPTVPLAMTALAILAALAIAIAAATYPGWRAARMPVGATLRAE
jgi:ABC-type lipoprotein release transport system permease subunit